MWSNPDEEHLAFLMDNASKLLRPSDGYEMEMNLVGVRPNDSTFEHLQRRFEYLLDKEKGSNMNIALHGDSNTFALNHFSSQIIKNAGQVDLQRVSLGDSLPFNYLPTVELRGRRYEASEFTWDQRWQEDLDRRLMEGHDLQYEIPRLKSANEYRMWLGHNILSRCDNWYLLERLVLRQEAFGKEVVRISIAHRQNMSLNTNTCSEALSILHEKEDLEASSKTLVSRQRLDLISGNGTPRFMLTSSTAMQSRYHQTPSRGGRRAVFQHAEADHIAEFTNMVEPVLSAENN